MNSANPSLNLLSSPKLHETSITVLLSERSDQHQQPSNNDFNISCDTLPARGQSNPLLGLKPLHISSSLLGSDLKSRNNFTPVKGKRKSNQLNLPALDITKNPVKTHHTEADESHRRLLDTASPLKSPAKEKEFSLYINKTSRELPSTNILIDSQHFKDGFLSDSRFTPTNNQSNTGLKKAVSEGIYESLNVSIDCQAKSSVPHSRNSMDTETHLTERFEYYNDNKRKKAQGGSRRSTVELELAKSRNVMSFEESKSSLSFHPLHLGDSESNIEKRRRSSSDILTLPHLAFENIRRKSHLDPVAENEAENDHVLESSQSGNDGRESTLASPAVVLETGHSTQAHNLQNHSENPDDTSGVQQTQAVEEIVSEMHMMPESEVKIFIQRMMILFISLAVLALLIFLKANGSIHLHTFFKVGYCIFSIFVLEKVYRTCCSEREGWRIREDLFSMLDGIDCLFLIGCVDQKLSNKLSVSVIAIIPFILTVILCYFTSSAPQSIKKKRILIRSILSIQVFLLTAKIDEILQIEWRFIFGPVWVFCAIVLLHLLAVMFILILIGIFAILKQRLHSEVDLKTEFSGHLWHCFYYGLSLGLVILMYGICSGSSRALKLSAAIGMILSITLIGYTALTKSTLVKFMKISYAVSNNTTRVTQIPINTRRIRKPTVSLEVEQKQSYFVMLSSTYFKPLDSGFIKNNEANITRIKSLIRRNIKVWTPSFKKKNSTVKENKDEPIRIEVLKQYKENLDKRFKVIKNSCFHEANEKPVMTRNFTLEGINGVKVATHQQESGGDSNQRTLEAHFKRHLSAEDRYFTKLTSTDRGQKNNTEEETLCYLCFERLPNAVLLSCGHGGICYECAVALITKKNECMECRKPVDMIYKVDPNPKLSNIIKGVEMSKVTVV